MTEIWHNPRCTKSRQTLALLQERGIEPVIRLYLTDAPNEADIRAVLAESRLSALALMRTAEARFAELGLGRDTDSDTLIAAMAANPGLIERPVVRHQGRAALGRPPENVLGLFA